MEKHKHRALSHVLKRSKKSFEDYLTALKPITKKLMESYRDLDEKWKDPDKFLQLMVLDGIFLIEINRFYFRNYPKSESDYCQNDPMFSSNVYPFTSVDLKNDNMLLENQLLCCLLDCLSDMSEQPMPRREQQGKQNIRTKEEADEGGQESKTISLHYLDNKRNKMIGNHQLGTLKMSYICYSTSELHKAGIIFERKDEHDSVLDITFDKEKGILSLPRIDVNRSMAKQFLNMVAFESLHLSVGREIRAYIQFIISLTHNVNDVLLLHSKRVIFTSLLDNEKTAELLQKLQHDMAYRPKTCYAELRVKMHDFCQKNMKKWNRRFREWRVNLKETYFNNP
ncbi:UPF0481 protein At3g47200-like [Aristolochia californica]|uniref:UPF0481 protein At3g47200-like n=1 Tax=Aristolochia californica TaxID=171875 RepID=UPI0035DCE21E